MRHFLPLLGVLALAACGGAEQPERRAPTPVQPPPTGFVTVQDARYAYARPSGWTRVTGRSKGLVGFQSAPGSNDLPSQVGLGINPRFPNTLGDAVRLAKDESRIVYPRYRIRSERPVALPRGARGWRIDAEYASFQAKPVTVRTIDLLVQTPEKVQMNFFVRAPLADFERERLGEALDSFQLR